MTNNVKINWYDINTVSQLSESFLRKFKDEIDWQSIIVYKQLSENFIKEFQNKINWCILSSCQFLSENFIREFQNKVEWLYISCHQKLSENFIREFKDKVSWKLISRYQYLSECFIREFKDKVDWSGISIYQQLSEDFIKEFNIKVPENSWMYKSGDYKLEQIRQCGKYDIKDDYVIAYKGLHKGRFSIFDCRYQYEAGKIYETRADYNLDNEDSFGFSAWTYEKAKDYCLECLKNSTLKEDILVIKVKIYKDDLAALIKDCNKIRCSKITILE